MKKTKTMLNISSLLCAMISVVFVFILGFTYSATSINYLFGNNPNSTSAYLTNHQYHIINDTIDSPVAFGEGAHNFEIAMQYSMPYDFDVCFKYTLSWSGDNAPTTENVILNFVNRDNIITAGTSNSEGEIYLAEAISAGSGKVTFICGVDFIDPTNEDYFGRSLTINISESDVKVCKVANYDDDNHYFKNESSKAYQMWLAYKQKIQTPNSKVLMFNYRQDENHGVPYPGFRTPYKQDSSGNTTRLAGNKSYAGIGMHIITGSDPVKLRIRLEGVWYPRITVNEGGLISESNVRFNYSSDWNHAAWKDSVWQEMTCNFVINANDSVYLDILDSIEITTASANFGPNINYEQYKMIVHKITINGAGEFGSGDLVFDYTTEKNPGVKELSSSSGESATYYTQPDIDVVNTSIYNNGLYETTNLTASQTYKTNVSLINNTENAITKKVEYRIRYVLSNGSTTLEDRSLNKVPSNDDMKANFSGSRWSSFYDDYEPDDHETWEKTLTIEKFSSINVLQEYTLPANLQEYIKDKQSLEDSYGVWTYVYVTLSDVDSNPTSQLTIESAVEDNKVKVSVKNKTNKVVNGLTISDLKVHRKLIVYTSVTEKPSMWETYFWNYYYYDADSDNYIRYDQKTVQDEQGNVLYYDHTYDSENCYTKTETVDNIVILDEINNLSEVELQPGDSLVLGEFELGDDYVFDYVSGTVTPISMADPTDAALIGTITMQDDGEGGVDFIKNASVIINNSAEDSYYIKFEGNLQYVDDNYIFYSEGGYTYYIGILRPGQIIPVSISSGGEISCITATDNYGKPTGWVDNAIALMEQYFAVK